MMYNAKVDPRPTPLLEACSDSERARAQVVIDACAHKPIRRYGPMDYSAAWNRVTVPDKSIPLGNHHNREAERASLTKQILALLSDGRKWSSIEIAAKTGRNIKAVAYAARDIDGIQTVTMKPHGRTTTMWWL